MPDSPLKISTGLSTPPPAGSSDPARLRTGRNDFQKILTDVTQTRRNPRPPNAQFAANSAPQPAANAHVTVRDGDTMGSIAQKTLKANGLACGGQAAMRAALQLAKDNGLPNPNLIFPGQKIDVSSIAAMANAREASANTLPSAPAGLVLKADSAMRPNAAAPAAVAAARPSTAAKPLPVAKPAHPVLEKTLDRAVSLQYFNASEKDAVRDKILQLAAEHHFSPDDLAIVTLIESDGMNPKANNGRCHGLIQFCDGPNRGAASVGYKDNPKAILDLSVLDQLDLVGKYFEETGLKNFGKNRPASLDDLYLTVLTPAARRERGLNTDLEIAGQQAASLRSGSDPTAPITRASLLQGLRQNARGKLAAIIQSQNRDATALIRVSALDAKPVKSSL